MGVYIENMALPKGCLNCPFVYHGNIDEFKYHCSITNKFIGYWSSDKIVNSRHKSCPLIELNINKQ